MLSNSRTSGSASLAWWAVLGLSAALAAGALLHDTNRETNPFWRLSETILTASKTTLYLMAASAALATLFGIVIAVFRVSRKKPLQFLGAIYVELIRGVPLLVLLLLIYYGVNRHLGPTSNPTGLDLRLSQFWAAVVGISLCYAAFIGEAIRAGIQAIPPEEIEAAVLEGNRFQVYRYIIVPQAFRIVLPSWTNEMVAMLKDTSLVYAVALTDITWAAKIFGASTGYYFEAYGAVALVYAVLTLLLSRFARWLELTLQVEQFHAGNTH
ncbi:MAG: amino acid ABC transporter permease [Candidatus Sumerlaeia bacterium]|nr:amino acid ABC transporter permease [Candidatus Sumerlaeia bacterium]